jgi:hypothetical protein
VTGRFFEKSAQRCPNIVRNGTLQNKIFAPQNYKSKVRNLKAKSSQNLELIKVNIGRYFSKKRSQH